MTRIVAAAALALAAFASSGPVEAKGCLKGALAHNIRALLSIYGDVAALGVV